MKRKLGTVLPLCLVVLIVSGCGTRTKQIELLNQRVEFLNQNVEFQGQKIEFLIQRMESQEQRVESLNERIESLTKQPLSESKVSVSDQPNVQVGGKININTATREQLMTLNGIGVVLADRIIAGQPYRRVNDLLKVKGIGEKTLEKIRDKIVVK